MNVDPIWSDVIEHTREITKEEGYTRWFLLTGTIQATHILYGYDFMDAIECYNNENDYNLDIENSVIIANGQI